MRAAARRWGTALAGAVLGAVALLAAGQVYAHTAAHLGQAAGSFGHDDVYHGRAGVVGHGQIIGRRPIARFDCLIAVTAQIEGQAVAVEVVVVGDENEVGLGFVTGVHGVLCGLI